MITLFNNKSDASGQSLEFKLEDVARQVNPLLVLYGDMAGASFDLKFKSFDGTFQSLGEPLEIKGNRLPVASEIIYRIDYTGRTSGSINAVAFGCQLVT